MTRPVSRVLWLPDPRDQLAIFAVWRGAGDDYTLFWGDGTSNDMPWWARPIRHRYNKPGTYRIVGRTTTTGITIEREVTVPPPRPPGTPMRATLRPELFDGEYFHASFRGADLPVGVTVLARVWDTADQWQDVRGTVEADGTIVLPKRKYTAPHPSFWPPWVHGGLWFPDRPDLKPIVCPAAARHDGTQPVTPLYTFDPADPMTIILGVGWPITQRYHIDWGDGASQHHDCDEYAMRVPHTYTGPGPYTITVTGADGRKGSRTIGAPTYKAPVVDGRDVFIGIQELGGDDFTPTYVDWGYPTGYPYPVFVSTGRGEGRSHSYPAGVGERFTVRVYGPLRKPDVHPITINTKGHKMSGSPALVSEGFVYPEQPVGLRVTNLFSWVNADKVWLLSPAFAEEGRAYEFTVATGGDGRKHASGEVVIGNVEPGEYATELRLPGGLKYEQMRVIVEDASDGTCDVSWSKIPDSEPPLYKLRAEGLSRNASAADARSDLTNNVNDWFGLVKEPYGTMAKGTATQNPNARPGQTYAVEVKQIFAGGREEIVKGQVTLPAPEPRDVGKLFTIRHEIDLNQLGEGNNVVHKIPFGSRRQTNTGYAWDLRRKAIDPRTGKGVLPTPAEAVELAKLEPYHFVRHIDHLELYTQNPHSLRGNDRFKLVYLVTVFPVADDETGFSDDDTQER